MRASNSGDVMDQISHCITDRREVFRLLVSALDTSKYVMGRHLIWGIAVVQGYIQPTEESLGSVMRGRLYEGCTAAVIRRARTSS
jgi:hypothetical protein